MERWEYKTVFAGEVGFHLFRRRKSAERIDEYFNEMGRQGWEMIQFHFGALSAGDLLAILKRRRS